MSMGMTRQVEKALAFGLGLAWIGWHIIRFGARRTGEAIAEEAQHTSAALRGRLEQLRGAP